MPFTKMGTFTFDHTNQQDDLYKGMSAAEIKAAFDSRGNELKDTINNLIDSLQAITDGASGADAIGVTPISTSPSTLQGALEWLQEQIAATTLGQIPDGSITETKLSFDPATQTELNNHKLEDASLTTKGHVQLSSSTTSTDETTAATPKAVKDASDAAKAASIPLSQKGAAGGVATLDGSGNLVQTPFVTGTYTGDTTNDGSRFISLGFTPKAVFVFVRFGTPYDSPYAYGGLAITGSSVLKTTTVLTITTNGFTVYNNSANSIRANNINVGAYNYIAFR